MNSKRILLLLLIIFIIHVECELKQVTKSKKLLPYFRRKVEEIEDAYFFDTTETDDPSNLVSFLVKNVREIFDDLIENSEKTTETFLLKKNTTIIFPNTSLTLRTSTTTLPFRLIGIFKTETNMSSTSISTSTHTTDMTLLENLPLNTLLDNIQESTENPEMHTSNELQSVLKDLKNYAKTDKKERDVEFQTILPYHTGNESDVESSDPRRSCILCDNVSSNECNDPKNKLIPSIMCERDDDMCYSLHTPFGIIDRGCFNVNHNLTTYVCSCNLCNYISISEMPFMFSKKRDWVDNVIELSRTKHFRRSVFKDMSCLRCEVNTTTKTGDMLDSANCLEGNIGNLPVEDCEVDEVCAVRALRADGYIWRGCIKAPLYNYWWAICDSDLCNYDTLTKLYEFFV